MVTVATGTGVKGPGSHSVRHWLQSGLNVNAVSAWLGHSSPTVTLNTYLVLAPDTLGDISEVPQPRLCEAHCLPFYGSGLPNVASVVRRNWSITNLSSATVVTSIEILANRCSHRIRAGFTVATGPLARSLGTPRQMHQAVSEPLLSDLRSLSRVVPKLVKPVIPLPSKPMNAPTMNAPVVESPPSPDRSVIALPISTMIPTHTPVMSTAMIIKLRRNGVISIDSPARFRCPTRASPDTHRGGYCC